MVVLMILGMVVVVNVLLLLWVVFVECSSGGVLVWMFIVGVGVFIWLVMCFMCSCVLV